MAEKETVTLTVDGIEVTIEKGAKVYDAAQKAGVYLPGLCYDPKLTRFGGCRMCVVDVIARGRARAKWACCEPAADGVEIVTNSEATQKKRQVMMEFLLMHHPLDCPTCNASGDCGLQNAAFSVKQQHGRLPQQRHNEPLLIDNPVIERDFNKCILCGKCVIACDELQGNRAIDFQLRGFEAEVGTQLRVPLDCDFCGQCLHVCPTGSFQDHTESYKGHDWEYAKTTTTCPYCAVGCQIVTNVKKGAIAKVTSDDHVGVNNGNLCARGRFGHEAYQNPNRVEHPLLRANASFSPVSWEEAEENVVSRIKTIVDKHGAESVAFLASESMTNEDAYLLQALAREGVGTGRIETLSNMLAPALNAELFENFGADAPLIRYDTIADAGCILFFGCDAEKENPVVANMIRTTMRDRLTPLYVVNSSNPLFIPVETYAHRYAYGSEGSVVAALARGGGEGNLAAIAEGIKAKGAPLIVIGAEIATHRNGAAIIQGLVRLAKEHGGKCLLYREYCNSQGSNDMGLSTSRKPGYISSGVTAGSNIFEDLSAGKIKALVVAGADPVTFYPDGGFVREAIQNAELVVGIGSFMSETLKLADIILPACTAVEREGTYTNNEGRVQLVRTAVESQGESRPEWRIFADIGEKMGLDAGYDSASDVATRIAAEVSGYGACAPSKLLFGDCFVSYSSEEKELPVSSPSLVVPAANGYPYRAQFGNSLYHLGGLSRQSVALNKIDPRAWVELSPADMDRAGLDDGESVVVESKQGSINAVAKLSYRAADGAVFITKNFDNNPALHLVYRDDDVTMVKLNKAVQE